MDTANKVMSAFPRDVDEQDFQQRDIGDVYYFEESWLAFSNIWFMTSTSLLPDVY